MIIAVEGMDGAGKTTVCKYISSHKNFHMIEKPTKYFFNKHDFNKVLEEMYNSSPLVRSTFFGLGNILAVNKYDGNIILDRHLVSNYYWNYSSNLDEIYDILVKECSPDLTILLYATSETRYKRLYKRNPHDIDLLDPTVFEDGTDKMVKFLEKYNMKYVIVDTNNMSIDEMNAYVERIIDGVENEYKERNRE